MNEKPTNITVNKKTREFTVNWDDGHVSVYPFSLLRAGCPCASCRGGHENMHSEPGPDVFEQDLPEFAIHAHQQRQSRRLVRADCGLGGRP